MKQLKPTNKILSTSEVNSLDNLFIPTRER